MSEPARSTAPESFGRYVLHAPIARGGMATVHIARLTGAEGFSRLVAAKRLHLQFTEDPDFVAMFHDEAHIASRIHHPNVVPVLDVVLAGAEVILVQEYVHGVPLDKLFKAALLDRDNPIPVGIAVAIVAGVLNGLHAAHDTTDERDEPLHIVHRDVSPQNVIVSVDGIPRLLDFGIAKARSSAHVTREGFFKGKIAYMAPEQLRAENVTRTADVYASGVLLWELLAHRRLHSGRSETDLFSAVLSGAIPTVSVVLDEIRDAITDERWEQLVELDPIVTRALSPHPDNRYATAAEMQDALIHACRAATPLEVAHWVRTLGADFLEQRHKVLASNEESWRSLSKIPITGSPESMSGVKLRELQDSGAPTVSASGSPVGVTEISVVDARAEVRRARIVPSVVAAGLLLIVGVLAGVLAVRGAAPSEPRPNAAVAARPPETATVTALTVGVPPEAPATVPPVVLAPAPRPAPPKATWSPPPVKAVIPLPRAVTSTPVPANAGSAAAPKVDCNPPFYFEGTKKLFKPSCI